MKANGFIFGTGMYFLVGYHTVITIPDFASRITQISIATADDENHTEFLVIGVDEDTYNTYIKRGEYILEQTSGFVVDVGFVPCKDTKEPVEIISGIYLAQSPGTTEQDRPNVGPCLIFTMKKRPAMAGEAEILRNLQNEYVYEENRNKEETNNAQ